MPPKLSPYTRALVEKIFSPKQVDEATRQLEEDCGNNLPGCENYNEVQMERFHFAAIKLSEGDLRKLHVAIDEARTDWRDLFMAAGFGYDVKAHEHWAEEILKK